MQDVLNFYNTATGNVLLAMSNDIERGQNSENWRLLNCYFSMIKVACKRISKRGSRNLGAK